MTKDSEPLPKGGRGEVEIADVVGSCGIAGNAILVYAAATPVKAIAESWGRMSKVGQSFIQILSTRDKSCSTSTNTKQPRSMLYRRISATSLAFMKCILEGFNYNTSLLQLPSSISIYN